MTLQNLFGILAWPGVYFANSAVANDATLDAAGEYVAYVFCAREAMTISHIGWRAGTVAGAPTAITRLESIAADGTPSGTVLGATNNATVTSGALSSNTFTLFALGESATLAPGEMFCVKILYDSGTSFNVTGLANIVSAVRSSNSPYSVTNVSGSAVKTMFDTGAKIIAFGSGAATFYSTIKALPCTAIAGNTFNNTNSAARGMRFKVPFKCRCAGIAVHAGASNGDYNAVLYDDAGSELASSSTAFDGNHSAENVAGTEFRFFDNPVTLEPGTWYRAAMVPSSVTNTSIVTVTLPSADYRQAWPHGTNAHYATRASGTWTDTATSTLPLINILIDQLDDGVSAGGGLKLAGRGGLAG